MKKYTTEPSWAMLFQIIKGLLLRKKIVITINQPEDVTAPGAVAE
jgi:hypothetical protein